MDEDKDDLYFEPGDNPRQKKKVTFKPASMVIWSTNFTHPLNQNQIYSKKSIFQPTNLLLRLSPL